ncbi:hypothetical protein M885DRAFT_518398 [Pelagophyceae sp. CCMP2097]|nr:hypothetical protein M885DRAFT_518398 [Pelagophyceae sp. CCMP2097]|mmetsp:Transcript_29837/g.103118  ORF Transcript_29837/g.103118 Transcript_29837/m.103118 type:complete len:1267 (+) Transcript_29837:2-3802(+)
MRRQHGRAQDHESMVQSAGLKSAVDGVDYADEHAAFAASRSSDYIYEAGDAAALDALDYHAESEGDSKLPLVITGAPGCGKSALLANWAQRRRATKHRDEFLFCHFVGCSPRSRRLTNLLHRLESGLKEHFQLREMEVPASEERLRWSLNRFLAAAAKKRSPPRIVIVLDAVNRLRGESSAADTLRWLPTGLPPGVRIVVSTTELDGGDDADNAPAAALAARSYTELRRRKCPTLRLQPLSVDVRHAIIGAFLKANQAALHALEPAQQFRLVTAKASSQPLVLRTILYALRLGFEMSQNTVEKQIEDCLAHASSSSSLIAAVLQQCSNFVEAAAPPQAQSPFSSDDSSSKSTNPEEHQVGCPTALALEAVTAPLLPRVLIALLASRHGLSDLEIWGLVQLSTKGQPLAKEQREAMKRVLRDFTFSVNGLRNFSHEDYAAVVYSNYIETPEKHINAHRLIAKYFARLPPCHRRLDALPYHLEVSASWSKLKNALVDVRMFEIWWTSAHKTEFLQLWASLTATANVGAPIRRLVTGEFDETMRCDQPSRPCLDIVDEYCASIDEYKFAASPPDEKLAGIILKIAQFMLEFATLAFEVAADVPPFVHPQVPNDDLASLGVPFLSTDRDGNSVMNFPTIESGSEDGPHAASTAAAIDPPMQQPNDEVPVCSTYFYFRWMWIQFPSVALANCGERFLKGVATMRSCGNSDFEDGKKSLKARRNDTSFQNDLLSPITTGGAVSVTAAAAAIVGAKLPQLRHIAPGADDRFFKVGDMATAAMGRAAAKSKQHDRAPPPPPGDVDHLAVSLSQLRGSISSYRSELDQLKLETSSLERKQAKADDEFAELAKMHRSTGGMEARLNNLVERYASTTQAHKMAKLLHQNYECVRLMCDRHPAHNPALIEELESKLTADADFIERVKQKVRETTFISTDGVAQNKVLQAAASDMQALQRGMLQARLEQRESMAAKNNALASKNLLLQPPLQAPLSVSSLSRKSVSSPPQGLKRLLQAEPDRRSGEMVVQDVDDLASQWEAHSKVVFERTFISDADDLFDKFDTAVLLQKQMRALHEAAEFRHRQLLKVLAATESDLVQARSEAQSKLGANSSEARELTATMALSEKRHKHSLERATAADRLKRQAFSGLKHICATLGVPPPDDDTPVNELIQQVEAVLEALIEEKDKTQQRMLGDAALQPNVLQDAIVRSPELDAAFDQCLCSKALVAHRLPAKASDGGDDDTVDDTNDRVSSRSDVKRDAVKAIRARQRRLARLSPA